MPWFALSQDHAPPRPLLPRLAPPPPRIRTVPFTAAASPRHTPLYLTYLSASRPHPSVFTSPTTSPCVPSCLTPRISPHHTLLCLHLSSTSLTVPHLSYFLHLSTTSLCISPLPHIIINIHITVSPQHISSPQSSLHHLTHPTLCLYPLPNLESLNALYYNHTTPHTPPVHSLPPCPTAPFHHITFNFFHSPLHNPITCCFSSTILILFVYHTIAIPPHPRPPLPWTASTPHHSLDP
ncbi:hypothetical protein Pcinc_040484 [Petrolisthes cinctipes]|uniref:Uncharacterized protein n=1 Tax=Petrolisthes cinctipes TaxID=88211 RepID=A0AAE1BMR0_PETCI|nr:hypothetical protein Pcinc_040484 [Petrolisthes cinctipes]